MKKFNLDVIDELLVFSKNTFGILEWLSGSIFVNCSLDEYEKNRKKGIIRQIIFHETFHSIQIASLGYLYKESYMLGQKASEWILPRFISELEKNDLEIAFANITNKIELIREYSPEIDFKIDSTSELNISIRDIIESHCYFIQKLYFNNPNSHSDFCNSIDIDKYIFDIDWDTHYLKSYKVAHEMIGDSVFDIFHLICVFSLCSHYPLIMFQILCSFARDFVIKKNKKRKDLQSEFFVYLLFVLNKFSSSKTYSKLWLGDSGVFLNSLKNDLNFKSGGIGVYDIYKKAIFTNQFNLPIMFFLDIKKWLDKNYSKYPTLLIFKDGVKYQNIKRLQNDKSNISTEYFSSDVYRLLLASFVIKTTKDKNSLNFLKYKEG